MKFQIKLLIIVLFFNILLSASTDKSYSFTFKNTPLIEALNIISEEAEIDFVYFEKLLTNKTISLSVKDQKIDLIIDKLLFTSGLKIGYKVENVYVIVKKNSSEKSSFDISGVVIDAATSEPLTYANIMVLESDYGTSTNKNGDFTLHSITANQLTLKIKYIGYSDNIVFLTAEDLSKELRIKLIKKSYPLESIIVTSGNEESLLSINKNNSIFITPKIINKIPSSGFSDYTKFLKLLPGVDLSKSGVGDISIRGGYSYQNLFHLDKIQLYQFDHFFGLQGAVSSDPIKQIVFYKTNYPARYGGKTSGVIDIITQNGNKQKNEYKFGLSNFGLNAYTNINLLNDLSLVVAGRKLLWSENLNGFYEKLTRHTNTNQPIVKFNSTPNIDFSDLYTKLNYAATENDFLSFSFLFAEDKNSSSSALEYVMIDSVGNASDLINEDFNNYIYWRNYGFALNWYKVFSGNLILESNFSLSHYKSNKNYTARNTKTNITDEGFNNRNRINNAVLFSSLEYNYSKRGIFVFGLEYNSLSIKYRDRFINEEEDGFLQDDSTYILSTFLEHQYKLNDFISLSTDLRTVYYKKLDKVYFEPRLRGTFDITKNIGLNLSYGKYNQFIIKNVEYRNYLGAGSAGWILADNESFFVNSSNEISSGIHYKLKSLNLNFSLEYFSKQFRNVNPFSSIGFYSAIENFTNNADQKINGIDFQIGYELKKYKFWINYSLINSEISSKNVLEYLLNDPEIQQASKLYKYPADNNSKHSIKFFSDIDLGKNFNLLTSYIVKSGKPYYLIVYPEDDDTYLNPQLQINRLPFTYNFDVAMMRKAYFYGVEVELKLSVTNLFNKSNILTRNIMEEDVGFNQNDLYDSARKYYFSININF